jgi:predicted phage tail protein
VDFLKLFLRGISLLPSLVQSVESLYGAKSGAQKKDAAISIVSSSINMADAVSSKQIADAPKFTAGLSLIVDGVVQCLNASLWAKPSESAT